MMEGYFVLFQVTLVLLHRNEDPRCHRFLKSRFADVRTFCLKCVFLPRGYSCHIFPMGV